MTDEEYVRHLRTLASKHLTLDTFPAAETATMRSDLERLSSTARLLKILDVEMRATRNEVTPLAERLLRELASAQSAVDVAELRMDQVGMLDALDDAKSLILAHIRRSVIPADDFELLRRAGYTEDEIELFVGISLEEARHLATSASSSRAVINETRSALRQALSSLSAGGAALPDKKKRKLWNGIGKILGGCIVGVGNALLAAGTIVAPNPATAYGAIASAGVAVPGMFTGVGDLRGE